jgi:hypothetical protein
LRALSYELPHVPQPAGSYAPATRTVALLLTAGQLPFKEELPPVHRQGSRPGNLRRRGQGGRLCAPNPLAAVKAETGSLENARRVAKITGHATSMFCFPEPGRLDARTAEFLAAEPEYLAGGWNLANMLLGLLVPVSLIALALAL